MIKELIDKEEFYYSDPVFRKYFVDRKKTEFEESKELELYNMVFDFFKKTFSISDDNFKNLIYRMEYFSFGAYLDNYGFYSLSDADRGYYDVEYYGDDINVAFYRLVDDILFDYANEDERNNHKRFIDDYNRRFDNSTTNNQKYFSSLYVIEYIISKWNIYFDGNVPEYIISYYEECMNDSVWSQENRINWNYNKETNQFDWERKHKTKKLGR